MNLQIRRALIAILVLSVILRIAAAFYFGDIVPPKSDELSYHTLAARVAEGYGFSFATGWYPFTLPETPTSHWSFLYTLFVAAVYAVTGPHPLAARLVQAVLAGILMPWLTYRLTMRLQGAGSEVAGSNVAGSEVAGSKVAGYRLPADRRTLSRDALATFEAATFQPSTVPLIATFLSAIYAYFILYAAMVQTEAFFICALLWSLERALALLQAQRNAQPANMQPSTLKLTTSLGISLGIATLLRQSILPWAGVLYFYLFLTTILRHRRTHPVGAQLPADHRTRMRDNLKSSLFNLSSSIVIVGLCIAPFTIRNYIVYDDFLLLNSNAGYAMYSGQHPMHGTSFQEYWAAPLPDDLLAQGLNEAQWDRALMRRGIGFVLAEPGRYLLLSLSRVRDYFEFWPTADSSALFNLGRVLSIGILLPFMLYGFALAILGRSSIFNLQSSILISAFMAFYSILHIATWAMSRYRLPVDAVALPFAALALWTLTARIRRHWHSKTADRVSGGSKA